MLGDTRDTTEEQDETYKPAASTSEYVCAKTANRALAEINSSDSSEFPSKSAWKNFRKREKTLQGRKLKKELAKSERHALALAAGRNVQQEQQLVAERTIAGEGWRRRNELWERERLPLAQKQSFQICFDCAYEEHMTSKEIASLASQIRCCYSYNKRNPHPCLLTATSLAGLTLELLEKETGYSEWPNRAFTGTSVAFQEYFGENSHNLVYLTSDSEHSITELDNNTIYIIGGIVDRNRLTRAAWVRANMLGIATAKLPLSEHLAKMPATRVLTCNHVFEILLRYRLLGNWSDALRAVLPARKEAEFICDSAATNDCSDTLLERDVVSTCGMNTLTDDE